MAGPIDPRLLRRARATRIFLVALAFVGAATAVLVLLQAWWLSRAISHVFATHDTTGVGRWAGLLLAVFTGRAALAWLNSWLAQRASASVKSQLRRDIAEARLARPLDAAVPASTLVTLVTQGLDALDGYYAKYLPQLVLAVAVPLIIGVAILTQDLASALIIAITLPLIPLFMALIGWTTQQQVARRWKVQTRLANHFADLMAGLPTLQVFGRARGQLEGLGRTEERNRTETMATLRISFLSAFALELLATLSVALVAVSIGFRVVFSHMDLPTALFILILAPEAYLPVRQVGVHYHDSVDGMAAADEAFALIEAGEAQRIGGAGVPDATAVLRLEHVSHTYPGTSAPALGDLTLDLAPGRLVALSGASGGGKSTALAIVMGFLAPTSGRVLVGDADLASLDLDAWRANLAYVAQTPGMLAGTIGRNVALGFPDASAAQLRDALDRAGGASLDLDRSVGDDGEGLSAGERRRVGVARALLRIEHGGARILILDEPTAGLDADTEAEVLASLRTSGAGALVVSHRPAVLAMVDEIVTVNASARAEDEPADA